MKDQKFFFEEEKCNLFARFFQSVYIEQDISIEELDSNLTEDVLFNMEDMIINTDEIQ